MKYKMNLGIMNILALILFIPLFFIIKITKLYTYIDFNFIIYYFLWMFLHEIIHGIGFYILGGKKIYFGICLEKGIMYCLCKEKVSKKTIMTSLIFPFTFIGIITLIIGTIINNSIIILLSLFNIIGSIGDIIMFLFFLRLPRFEYLDTGECDSFVLISSNDLNKYKSIYFKKIGTNYKITQNEKKITISKASWIIMVFLLILYIINRFI